MDYFNSTVFSTSYDLILDHYFVEQFLSMFLWGTLLLCLTVLQCPKRGVSQRGPIVLELNTLMPGDYDLLVITT